MSLLQINSLCYYHKGLFYLGHNLKWKAIRKRTQVTGYPVISNGIDWVNSMLQSCSTGHKSCLAVEDRLLPKRTISFQKSPSGDISVKLQEHEAEKGRYIALSHCWGSAPTCTTTHQNLKEYQSTIPWMALPTTFRDSIIFSLELGIHHLWIDALCIVQDNARDWEIESSKMADVYQNAFMTLAATTSSDGSGGCFSVHYKPVREFKLSSWFNARNRTSLFVREKLDHWRIPSTRVSAESYPLLSRGWALQERYLSRRMLHFCQQELIWECMEQLVCECGGIHAACDPLERELLTSDRGEKVAQEERYLTLSEGVAEAGDENTFDRAKGNAENIGQLHITNEGEEVFEIVGGEVLADQVEVAAGETLERTSNELSEKLTEEEADETYPFTNQQPPSSPVENVPVSSENVAFEETPKSRKERSRTLRLKKKFSAMKGAAQNRLTRPKSKHLELDRDILSLQTSAEISPNSSEPMMSPKRFSSRLSFIQAPLPKLKQALNHTPDLLSLTKKSISLKQMSAQWRHIVEQYSVLKLSRETDRLPALSGLAVRASAQFGRYLCGLWFETLALDLLWRVPLLDHGHERPAHYTAPTWSWASVITGVNYWHELSRDALFDRHEQDEDTMRLRDDSERLESWFERGEAMAALRRRVGGERDLQRQAERLAFTCDVTLAGESPFGKVTSGRLEITGQLQKATLQYVSGYQLDTSQRVHDPLHYQVTIHGKRGYRSGDGIDLELPFFADYILSEGPHAVSEGSTISLLLMYPSICLVLRQKDGVDDYERIGIIKQSSAYLTLYGLNWMLGSSPEIVTIV
jgi:hypothetical protein